MARLPRVEIQAWLHPRYQWMMVPVAIDEQVTIDMVVNPGVPRSSISTGTRDRLIMTELVPPRNERVYTLTTVSVQGQALPPLRVRVSGMLHMTGAGGILGLDFFGQYEDIHFHVPTLRLTLSGP